MAVRIEPAHATVPPPSSDLFRVVAAAIRHALDWPDTIDVRDATLVAAKAAYGAIASRGGARLTTIVGLECDYDEGRKA